MKEKNKKNRKKNKRNYRVRTNVIVYNRTVYNLLFNLICKQFIDLAAFMTCNGERIRAIL